MKYALIIILTILPFSMFAQEIDPALQRDARKLVREGNELYNQQKFSDAEVAYKKALANDPGYEIASYNLGNALSQQERGEEAIAQYQLTAKLTKDKMTKSEAYHNIGNTHFDGKKYQEAVEAYKNSMRNNPRDDETRYNLALAQKLLDDQQQKDKDNKDNKDNKDDKNKDKKDQKNDENKDDQQDKKDDEKDGDEKNDQNQDPNKDQQDKKDQKQDQKPQPGKLSPQQVQQLLEAMNNEEKKTQEKMNARKEKGKKIKQEKDW